MSADVMLGEKIREKVIECRRSCGMKRRDVVAALQLYGFELSYQAYKEIELGIRKISAQEFLLLATILLIDPTAILPERAIAG